MTDEELVVKIQKGQREMFGEIIDRYQGKLFGYVKNMVNQKNEEVEDLVADTFLKAYENILGCDPKKKFSSWIYRIAHNRAIDYFKKRKLKVDEIDDKEEILVTKEKLMEEIEIEKEQRTMIGKAIKGLELNYREVVLLYFFEEKSYEEISDILKIPTSNVGVLLFRAKKQLKQILNTKF